MKAVTNLSDFEIPTNHVSSHRNLPPLLLIETSLCSQVHKQDYIVTPILEAVNSTNLIYDGAYLCILQIGRWWPKV